MDSYILKRMLRSGLQLGHLSSKWHPLMFPYIYKELNNIYLLDVIQSLQFLEKTMGYCSFMAKRGSSFLFIGTKQQVSSLIAIEAQRSRAHYINYRWLGGMLTNWVTIYQRITYLHQLKANNLKKIRPLLKKKEASLRQKELKKFNLYFRGVTKMVEIPDVALVIDQHNEMNAVKELNKLKIPIISLLDTNCNPILIDFPIPGNDDAVRGIKLILNALTDSIINYNKFK